MNRTKACLLFFIIPLLALLIVRMLGFDGLYGMDSYEYFRYAGELKKGLKGEGFSADFFWPKGYPLLIAVFSFFMPLSFAGQLVSTLSLSGICYYTFRLLTTYYKEEKITTAYLLITILLAPYLIRNSIQVMADLPATFFLMASCFYSISFYQNKHARELLLCGAFAFFGALTRYGILVPLFPLCIFTAYVAVKNIKVQYLYALVIPILLMVLHFYFAGEKSEFTSHHFIEEWSFKNYFKREFFSTAGINLASLKHTYPNIMYYFGLFFYPGFLFLNIIFFFYRIKNRQEKEKIPTKVLIVIALMLLFNSFFLSGTTFQGDRYLFPVYPLFVVLIFSGFFELQSKVKPFLLKKGLLSIVIITQVGLSARAVAPTYNRNKLEKKIVEELKRFQNNTLYSFEMDLALQQRGLNFKYENLWEKEYRTFKKNSLVLFNESKFEKRFEGKTPMVNWEKLKSNHRLKIVQKFDSGWEIYRIEN